MQQRRRLDLNSEHKTKGIELQDPASIWLPESKCKTSPNSLNCIYARVHCFLLYNCKIYLGKNIPPPPREILDKYS